MTFQVNDRVRFNNQDGIVTRINILKVKKSVRILFDNGKEIAVFGNKYDTIKKI